MKHSQIIDEMIESLVLDHAEKLVGNLGSFIGTVMDKMHEPIRHDQKTLHEIYNILIVMEIEAIGYRNDLQEKKAVTFPTVVKSELKRLTLKMNYMFINDSKYDFFSYYITIHSGVKALECLLIYSIKS